MQSLGTKVVLYTTSPDKTSEKEKICGKRTQILGNAERDTPDKNRG